MLIAREESNREFRIYPGGGADCHDTCIRRVEINYYWENEDDQGNLISEVRVARIRGTLVLAAQMDEDPVTVCDDEEQDLGYVMKVTQDIIAETLFYLSEYVMVDSLTFPLGIDDEIEDAQDLLQQIVDSLPETLLALEGAEPDTIAVYPAALDYEQDEITKKRHERAMEALRTHMNAVEELHRPLQEGEPENRIVFSISNGYQLTENDMDYFMGSGGGYPANAKNEAEFRMWESVDFVEINDTRIMVRADDLPDSYDMFDDEDEAEYDDEDDNDSFDF